MSNLIGIIEGYPASGKTRICSQIATRYKYVTKDIDIFTQDLLKKDNMTCNKFMTTVNSRVKAFLKSHSKRPVVLCGLSTIEISPDCVHEILSCNGQCAKIWLDITPENFVPPSGYKSKDPELLEACRRSVIREFEDPWKFWSDEKRAEEGKFWLLPSPQKSLSKKRMHHLLSLPLHTFIKQYKPYFDAMYKELWQEDYYMHRKNAIQNGFIPMTFDNVLVYFSERKKYFPYK